MYKKKHSYATDIINFVPLSQELDMIEAIKSVLLADPINLPPIVANMKNLRWIEWNGGLANPLPTHFSPRKLCFLKLDCIRPKQLWEGYKVMLFYLIIRLKKVIDEANSYVTSYWLCLTISVVAFL